jgi:putative ABC transport system permease protein
MNNPKTIRPPVWPRKLLEWSCSSEIAEDLLGDVEEIFLKNIKSKTVSKAKLIYIRQCLSLVFSYAIRARRSNNKSSYSQNSISMFNNYFKTAYRSLTKQTFFSVINIAGLAVGMSVGLLAVAALVDILTVDDFHHDKDRIYRVTTQSSEYISGEGTIQLASIPEPLGYELMQGYQGIQEVVRFNKSISGSVYDEVEDLPVNGYYTDANFFKVFGYTLESGNPETALVDPFSIVLTRKSADKFFHGQNAMGKELIINNKGPYKVTGVLAPSPRSHLLFEVLGSYSTRSSEEYDQVENDWQDLGGSYAYVLIDNKASVESLKGNLSNIAQRHYSGENQGFASFSLQSISAIPMSYEFYNEIGIVWGWPAMLLFFAISLLILIPACFNYANLSISRSIMRSKEIGLRKVVGGLKQQVFMQFLVESLLTTCIALLGAVMLFLLAREEFLQMIVHGRKTFDFELDFLTGIGFVLFSVISAGIAGITPAIYFSRLSPLETLRASKRPSKLKKASVRKVLTVLQFSISLFFIMGIAIILKQYKYALNYDYGFQKENILDIKLSGVNPNRLKVELDKIPEVKSVSFSSHIPGTHEVRSSFIQLREIQDSLRVFEMFVDPAFVNNLNLKVVAGTNLPKEEALAQRAILVNKRFLKQFQIENPIDAIGKEYTIEGEIFVIHGVIKDFNFRALRETIEPFLLRSDYSKFGYANLKIASTDILGTLAKLETAWDKVAEERKFEASFLNDEIDDAMISFTNMIKIFGGLGVLSIVVSCLGLLGMVVFTVENKIKEVGVRKVMGASVTQIVVRLSGDFFKFLIYASLITTPVAYFFFDKIFLRMQHFRANIEVFEVGLSILFLFAIGLITILSQTHKAANANPADTLRYE